MTTMTIATTGRPSEPREKEEKERRTAEVVDAGTAGYGSAAEDVPTTTVAVVPLWERLRTGSCGVRG